MKSSEEMLKWVPGYYSESNIYREQNNAKGNEFDIIKYIIDTLKYQMNPVTATWALDMWEELCKITPDNTDTTDRRRKKIIAVLSTMTTITPAEMVRLIKRYGFSEVSVIEHYSEYTFDIHIDAPQNETFYDMINAVEKTKPAHLAVNSCEIKSTPNKHNLIYSMPELRHSVINITADNTDKLILGRE